MNGMRILLLIPLLVLIAASNAFGQPAAGPPGATADGSWLTPAAAVIFAGFIIAVSIKKSKREHRD